MTATDRRSFLKLLGASSAAAAMPGSIRKALEIPADRRTGTIADVEHIVILTQENRSFDHLFGTMRGVRGFGDPRAVYLPSGKPVWNQPNGGGEVLPFRPPVKNLGLTFLSDPPHGWNDTHAAWNGGRMNQWVAQKGLTALTYHTRSDIPFHFALADAFTVCDAYHCSVMGPTDPNRYHLWTGWVGNDGAGGGPVITNAEAGYDWSTYPERLERAGISWKVYQDIGVGLTAAGFWGWTGDQPYIGNYGDNSLLYFHQYQNAVPGQPLADRAKVGTNIANGGTLFDQLRADVESGNLPQVSWIAAPEAYTEHPVWPVNWGAWYISQVLDILTSRPEVWSRTVFLLNYDEEGGFFDHMVPPTPADQVDDGGSTVSTVNEMYPGDASHPAAPYGLGFRVPLIVVSPWSKGGYVCSQVFDHTSVIKFIEARFAGGNRDLIEANITPWRRSVVGDLTSAFNFANPNTRRVPLPATAGYEPPDRSFHDPIEVTAPAAGELPTQERGTRPARALPYELHANRVVDAATGSIRVEMRNTGGATAVFQARSADATHAPRNYTVEPGRSLAGSWSVPSGQYDLAIHGPNGFYRRFAGDLARPGGGLAVTAVPVAGRNAIEVTVANRGAGAIEMRAADAYRSDRERSGDDRSSAQDEVWRRRLAVGASDTRRFSLDDTNGWYDLTFTVSGDDRCRVQVAGHVETGRESTSDPALGRRRPVPTHS